MIRCAWQWKKQHNSSINISNNMWEMLVGKRGKPAAPSTAAPQWHKRNPASRPDCSKVVLVTHMQHAACTHVDAKALSGLTQHGAGSTTNPCVCEPMCATHGLGAILSGQPSVQQSVARGHVMTCNNMHPGCVQPMHRSRLTQVATNKSYGPQASLLELQHERLHLCLHLPVGNRQLLVAGSHRSHLSQQCVQLGSQLSPGIL